MKLIIGSDFAGFQLKEEIKQYLLQNGHQVEDLGQLEEEGMTPYFKVAAAVAKRLQEKTADKAILVCGTGAGMCIVANKFKGVYAVACESIYTARKTSIVNDANVLALGGRVVGGNHAVEMVESWLPLNFLEGFPAERHQFLTDALASVRAIEDENFK